MRCSSRPSSSVVACGAESRSIRRSPSWAVQYARSSVIRSMPRRYFGAVTLFIEYRLLLFQLSDFVVEFCLVQEVVVARKDRYELGEIHAVVLVHRVLVDAPCRHRTTVDLVNEHLFVLQEIELVGIEFLFRAVDDDIDLVAAPQFHRVALADGAAVALLQVGRSPRYIEVMHRHRPLLGIDARAEQRGRAEQHPNTPCIHILDNTFFLASVDITIDQDGCFGTSHPTTHEDPVYYVDGILHYCVANIPGAVPYTSTLALTNATLPYAIQLADKGWRRACRENRELELGLNIVQGKVVYKPVADAWGLNYEPLTL